MRSIFISVLFLSYSYCHAQHEGLGLRLGEPTGITYKRYFSNSSNTLELGVGLVQRGWNGRYYRKSFKEYDKFSNVDYITHNVSSNFFIQSRFLKHYPWHIEGVDGDFEWYWGIGALVKIARVNYLYRTSPNTTLTESDEVTDLDLGPEIPLGVEYTFTDTPITLFAEVSVFIEIANRSGVAALNGGVGMRYNFFRRK